MTNTDGSKSWYSSPVCNTCPSLAIDAFFYIYKFEDVNGNQIKYEYIPGTILSNNITPTRIKRIYFSYNNFSNTTFQNTIVFNYKNRQRNELAYFNGGEFKNLTILDFVQVFTKDASATDQLFRKYQLNYSIDDLSYERLSNIVEFNDAGEAANPVQFDYYATVSTNVGAETVKSYSNNIDFSAVKLSGDFDGDGKMDMIANNNLYTKLFEGNSGNTPKSLNLISPANKMFSAVTIDSYNKLNQFQSIVNVNESLTQINFEIYNKSPNSVPYSGDVALSTVKLIYFGNNAPTYQPSSNITLTKPIKFTQTTSTIPCQTPNIRKTNEFLEGDFNGDGVTEVLISKAINERYYFETTNFTIPFPFNNFHHSVCETKYIDDGKQFFLVDFKSNASTLGENGYIQFANASLLQGEKRYLADFNGDGKTDVMTMTGTNYKIVGFRQLTVSPWVELQLLGQGVLDAYSSTKQILFGDYNGDGKIDIMLPNTEGGIGADHTTWHIYYSKPWYTTGSFFVKESFTTAEYWPDSAIQNSGYYVSQRHIRNFYPMDVNRDGKTDLVRFEIILDHPDDIFDAQNVDSHWELTTFVNNFGKAGTSRFAQDYQNPCIPNPFFPSIQDCNHSGSTSWLPIPIAASFRNNGLDNQFVVVREYSNTLTYTNFTKDFNKDNTLKKVTQSGGTIVDEIEYLPMQATPNSFGSGNLSDFYSSRNNVVFPLVELKELSTQMLVSKIKNTSVGVTKFQDFKYHGYIADLEKRGAIGFTMTARSSWYRTNSDKKIWNVSILDPLIRGASKTNYSQLFEPNVPFSFSLYTINPQNLSGLISKTETSYFPPVTETSRRKYTLLLQTQTTTDYLSNVITEKTFGYSSDGYNLPTSTITKKYLGTTLQGTITSTASFENSITGTGAAYYIGRPISSTTTIEAYGDTKSTNEVLAYTNSNITTKEKRVGTTAALAIASTEKIVETMVYHPSGNGNLISKTLSAVGFAATVPAIVARTTSYTYDTTNRFIKTTTDVDGIVSTNDTYHPLYGVVLQQTNTTLGQTTTSVYDNWGKRTKVTDFLGKSVNYAYVKGDNIYTTAQGGSDDSNSIVESDALGRVIRKGVKDLFNNWSYTNTEYDWLGRKYRQSLPYFANETPSWSTITYDDYSRPIQTKEFNNNKTTTIIYNGLTTSTNDGRLVKTSTTNANGHIISTSDNAAFGTESGGTISNSYDALGNVINTNYDGINTVMTYDLWGRKKTVIDPSAGLFSYTYNAFGELLNETNPKGFTDYTYTPTGKPLTKWVKDAATPVNTNLKTTYSYDTIYKWLVSMSVVNPIDGNSTYAYSYDVGTANGNTNTKQLNKTVETISPTASGDVTFTKELKFDEFGRVAIEKNTATAHGQSSIKTTNNTYLNGEHFQTFEGLTPTGTPLWQTNGKNARSQLTSAKMGNGVAITNTYDSFGFPKQQKHDKTGTIPNNIINLNNSFDIYGDLEFREIANFPNNISRDEYLFDSLDRINTINNIDYTTTLFDSDIGGFIASSQCYLSNENGKLNATMNYESTSMTKQIATNVKIGSSVSIDFDISYVNNSMCFVPGFSFMCNNASLKYAIYEKDPLTGNIAHTIDGFINELANSTGLSITTYSEVYFKVYITGSNNGNSPLFGFTLDNLKIGILPQDYTYLTYDNRGKILTNELGTYNYTKVANPYQNTSVTLSQEGNNYYSSRNSLIISYNAFQSPIRISEQGKDMIDFGYNTMQQRMVMYYGSTNTNKLLRPYRKYYSADGSMEVKYILPVTVAPTAPEKLEFFTYVGGDGYSAPIVSRKIDGATAENFYLHRDYQGSILAITNSIGAVVEKRQFDAWGNITKIQDGAGNALTKLTFFDRGYTGHEHLQGVALINMNARLYDPKLRRFLQPDNYLQDPSNTQNYNKYAYCVNNPLKYTDKSGNIFVIDDLIICGIIIGAMIGGGMYALMVVTGHAELSFGGAIQSVFMGALSGGVTAGIGTAVSTIAQFGVRFSVQALAHGLFQGGLAAAQGGKFWSSFAAGSVASLASSFWMGGALKGGGNWGGIGGNFAQSTVGTLLFGTLAGGAGAKMTGGNFWEGAVTGLIVSGLNHAMHKISFNKELRERFNTKNVDPDGKPNLTKEGALNLNKNVEGLEQAYNDGGKPNIRFDIKSNKYVGLTDFGDVNLNPSKITTNLKFAAVLFHEYRHAWQYASGNYYHWQKEFGYSATENYQERDAYWFQNKMGAGSFFEGWSRYADYSMLTKGITYK